MERIIALAVLVVCAAALQVDDLDTSLSVKRAPQVGVPARPATVHHAHQLKLSCTQKSPAAADTPRVAVACRKTYQACQDTRCKPQGKRPPEFDSVQVSCAIDMCRCGARVTL